jgi:HD domain
MNIVPFQDFLTSLAEISRCQFEIWEGHDVIFATAPGATIPADRQALVAAIMSGGMYRQVTMGEERVLAGAPLRDEEAVVGALIAWDTDSRPRSPSGAWTLEAFLVRLTEIIQDGWSARTEREKITEELGRSFEDLYLYARISSWVKTMRFSTGMLDDLIGQILETMHVDLAFVRLEGRQGGKKLFKANHRCNRISDNADFIDRLLGAIPEKETFLEEHYFVVNDSRLVSGYGELHAEPFRALMVMIQNNKNFYGWFGVASFNLKDIFSRSQLRLIVSIAEQIAVIITNTELYQELEEFVINMVKSLVQAIEAKDVYTRGHSERVSRYSMLMAERLALDDEQKNYLHWASILHDVGKIGIPEGILNNAGPLTAKEYELIKSHPAKGYSILKPLQPLTGSLPGILHHHERYDGSGYPDGLRGEQIPLLARIIAVPDTFDALNSDRAYRLGKTSQNAMAIVESLADTQLDPSMVRILVEIIREMDDISEKERMSG